MIRRSEQHPEYLWMWMISNMQRGWLSHNYTEAVL
jgi:hypothetical protein